jgi:hypothetical protein
MGLSVNHDSWTGSYSAFGAWRSALFDAAYGGGPRSTYAYLSKDVWHATDFEAGDPLVELLTMSDSNFEIAAEATLPLAGRLTKIMPRLAAPYREWTEQFIAGLGRAHVNGDGLVSG